MSDHEPESQHPADLKPRTGKAPLHLIPWSAVPVDLVPSALVAAAWAARRWPDGDAFVDDTEDDLSFESAIARAAIATIGLDEIALAFEFGAVKYARDNWRCFTWNKAAEDSYFGAICRHLTAIDRGEDRAADSGVHHWGHVGAGALIWSWHLMERT